MLKKIGNFVLENIFGMVLSVVLTSIVSTFLVYYIIITSSIWIFISALIVVSILVYLLIIFLITRYKIPFFGDIAYKKPISLSISVFLVSGFLILISECFTENTIDYTKTNIQFIQNIRAKNNTAIIKNNNGFTLKKDPVINHPYMGVLSFGKFNNDKRFLVEMEGTLRGESQVGVVLLKDGKMPTEYIELLASTTTDNIALNDVDGKKKNNIEKETVPLYEDQKFKIFVDYKKYDNSVCVYYNSIYTSLFPQKCISLPNNLDLKFIGFKIVDDDLNNNNLYTPEISKFVVKSLRF